VNVARLALAAIALSLAGPALAATGSLAQLEAGLEADRAHARQVCNAAQSWRASTDPAYAAEMFGDCLKANASVRADKDNLEAMKAFHRSHPGVD
jgi:hypothetical protein